MLTYSLYSVAMNLTLNVPFPRFPDHIAGVVCSCVPLPNAPLFLECDPSVQKRPRRAKPLGIPPLSKFLYLSSLASESIGLTDIETKGWRMREADDRRA